jgi:hypothetical protein
MSITAGMSHQVLTNIFNDALRKDIALNIYGRRLSTPGTPALDTVWYKKPLHLHKLGTDLNSVVPNLTGQFAPILDDFEKCFYREISRLVDMVEAQRSVQGGYLYQHLATYILDFGTPASEPDERIHSINSRNMSVVVMGKFIEKALNLPSRKWLWLIQ